jgi:hypothetical protein
MPSGPAGSEVKIRTGKAVKATFQGLGNRGRADPYRAEAAHLETKGGYEGETESCVTAFSGSTRQVVSLHPTWRVEPERAVTQAGLSMAVAIWTAFVAAARALLCRPFLCSARCAFSAPDSEASQRMPASNRRRPTAGRSERMARVCGGLEDGAFGEKARISSR